MRRIRDVLAALHPWIVLGVAWAFVLVYAFPGLMTQDSFDHMREARLGVYSDAHPPFINVVWKLCDSLIAGQLGFLLLQTGLLLAGLYAILRHVFDARRAAWWTLAVFAFPPVMLVMSVIWKDCVMAGLLALGIAGLLSPRRGVRVAGLVALVGATAARYNAFGATFPLVVLLFEWRPGLHWVKRYALSTAAWLATALGAFGINGALTDKPMHYWHSSLAIYDIVGTLAHVDDLSDEQLSADLAGTELLIKKDIHAVIRADYDPRNFYPILNDPERTMWNLPINGFEPAPQAQRDAIERAWWHTVTTYPWAYVEHRLAVTAEVLDLRCTRKTGALVKREFRYPEVAASEGLANRWSPLQKRLTRVMEWFVRKTPLFLPWIYLLLSLVLVVAARRQRDVLAIVLSGIGLESTLVVLVHSNDYRYSHWMVVTTLVGAIMFAARRRQARHVSHGSG